MACVHGWDKEDFDILRMLIQNDCEPFSSHCRGVEVYGQWEQDDSVIEKNLDL